MYIAGTAKKRSKLRRSGILLYAAPKELLILTIHFL